MKDSIHLLKGLQVNIWQLHARWKQHSKAKHIDFSHLVPWIATWSSLFLYSFLSLPPSIPPLPFFLNLWRVWARKLRMILNVLSSCFHLPNAGALHSLLGAGNGTQYHKNATNLAIFKVWGGRVLHSVEYIENPCCFVHCFPWSIPMFQRFSSQWKLSYASHK